MILRQLTDRVSIKSVDGRDVTIITHGDTERIATTTSDIVTEIAKGSLLKHKIVRGVGERESIGITAQGEDIWRGNQLSNTPAPLASHTSIPVPASAGEQMSIISESDADNGATATGALTVTIEYLDGSGLEQTTIVTMNGTTAVPLTPSDVSFVNDMHVTTVGSNTVPEGNIRIYETSTPSLVYNMIGVVENKSLTATYKVPAGHLLLLKTWVCSEGNGKRLSLRLRADCNNATPPIRQAEVFLIKSIMILNKATSPQIMLAYSIPALSIVKVSAWANAVNGEASVHWWGILEES